MIKQEFIPHIENILNSIPEVMFIKDLDCRYVFISKFGDEQSAKNGKKLIGKTDLEIFPENMKFAEKSYADDLRIINEGITSTAVHNFSKNNGKLCYVELVKAPIKDETGNIIGICGNTTDVTELILLRYKYEKMGLIDSLTQIYQRNYTVKYDFNQQDKLPCSYILCDCNYLKKVNDQFGHTTGDEYIRRSVEVIKDVISDRSVPIRWGGDEFLIITPNCTESEHQELIHDLNEAQKSLAAFNSLFSLSVGGVVRHSLEEKESEAIRAADIDMYQNKQAYYQQRNDFNRILKRISFE